VPRSGARRRPGRSRRGSFAFHHALTYLLVRGWCYAYSTDARVIKVTAPGHLNRQLPFLSDTARLEAEHDAHGKPRTKALRIEGVLIVEVVVLLHAPVRVDGKDSGCEQLTPLT
jgi:hypothetical protein